MKELKIDEELKNLLPSLTQDEYKRLEKSITEKGFDKNFPIIVWNGFVVDGHNRYEICLKHNIDFISGNLAYDTKQEVMEWMISTQLSRRNLSPIQRIAVVEKYEDKIRERAKENMSVGGSKHSKVTPIGEPLNSIHTDKELAKLAGVSTGTMARYKVVKKSDDEEIKDKMLKEEITVSKAYSEVKKKRGDKVCKVCNKEKPLIDFFGDDDICKECKRQESTSLNNNSVQGGSHFVDYATGQKIKSSTFGIDENIMAEIKTEKKAFDYVNVDDEIMWLEQICEEFLDNVDGHFFTLIKSIQKFTDLDIDITIDVLNDFQIKINKIIKKFNENKGKNNKNNKKEEEKGENK